MSKTFFSFFVLAPFMLFCQSSLFEDLQILESCRPSSFPLLFSHSQQVGYFMMPSARMQNEGDITSGFALLPPYRLFGLHYQFFRQLDLSFHYWIYHDLFEKNFGKKGFGDDADRTASVKCGLLLPKDPSSFMPAISIGWDDFMGTKRFSSLYAVMTKSFFDGHLEASLGWGKGRIRGPFGALFFAPFMKEKNYMNGLSAGIEYDATDYGRSEEHPKAKKVSFPINGGLQYRFLDLFHFALSSLRGRKMAFSTGLQFDLGNSSGLFPKHRNPPLYRPNPVPIGPLAAQKEQVCYWICGFASQGFVVYAIDQISQNEKKILRFCLINGMYRSECDVKKRIEEILISFDPNEYSEWIVVVSSDGLISHEYSYCQKHLAYLQEKKSCNYERDLLFIKREITPFSFSSTTSLYAKKKLSWTWTVRPRFLSYFGSSKGKFKYDLGLLLETEGFLPGGAYYDLQGSYIAFSTSRDVGDRDCLNPSLLPHVRSDFVRYYQTASVHLDVAYLQKNWNLRKGWFGRVSGGYYEIAYGGITGEFLYYPVRSDWAWGLELSTLMKRDYHGIGFQKTVQKLEYNQPKQIPFMGLQFFLTLSYHFPPLDMDLSVQAGQFLAKDKGVRFEASRSYSSGLHLSLWYTITDGKDVVNGKRYFDKGFSFSMPLDFFLNKSSREKVGYSMSAWLRDVGAIALTGKKLFPLLNDQRRSK